MHPLKKIAGGFAALALCINATAAVAAVPAQIQPISPLIAVSAFGTQASAQAVCGAVVSGAAAAAAQGQAGCVLPVNGPPPPPPMVEGVAPPVGPSWDLGTSILLGLGGLFLVAGIITLFNDNDNDNGNVPISPA